MNLHRWLKGSFVCKKCGREFFTMCFGFGTSICPDCYRGEQPFMFFDNGYWLNRITTILLNHRACVIHSYNVQRGEGPCPPEPATPTVKLQDSRAGAYKAILE